MAELCQIAEALSKRIVQRFAWDVVALDRAAFKCPCSRSKSHGALEVRRNQHFVPFAAPGCARFP